MSLQNFRSWENTGEISLAPITGFFGTNSSGKSSLLRFLLLLKQTSESSDQGAQLELGGRGSLVDFGSMSDLLFDHDTKRTLGISLGWDQQTWPLESPEGEAASRWRSALGSPLVFSATHTLTKREIRCDSMSYEIDTFKFGLEREQSKYRMVNKGYELIRPQGRPSSIAGPIKSYGFPASTRLAFTNASFLQNFELAFEQTLSNVFYLGPLREDPQRQYAGWRKQAGVGTRGEFFVDALLAARERNDKVKIGPRKYRALDQYVAEWLQRLGLVQEFKVDEVRPGANIYQVLVKRSEHSPWVPLTDVGFGVSQILPVLTLCFSAPMGSTLILEQPEIHLHPKVQAGLADVFIDAMKLRKIQIIVESHSEHFLQRLLRRVAEETIAPDDAALYFCEAEEERSTIRGLDVDLFGSISNWPVDFFGDPLGEAVATARAAAQNRLRLSA
jgi:predicted ATPase